LHLPNIPNSYLKLYITIKFSILVLFLNLFFKRERKRTTPKIIKRIEEKRPIEQEKLIKELRKQLEESKK